MVEAIETPNITNLNIWGDEPSPSRKTHRDIVNQARVFIIHITLLEFQV